MAESIIERVSEQLEKKKLKPEIEDGDYFVWGKGPLEWKRNEQNPYNSTVVLMISPAHPEDLAVLLELEIGSTKLLRIPYDRSKIELYEIGDKIKVIDGRIKCKLPLEGSPKERVAFRGGRF